MKLMSGIERWGGLSALGSCRSGTWGVAPGWYGFGALPLFLRRTLFLPPLATPQQIVAELEAEQALVAANRELITRFEQKIQATLARIWGEETPATP